MVENPISSRLNVDWWAFRRVSRFVLTYQYKIQSLLDD